MHRLLRQNREYVDFKFKSHSNGEFEDHVSGPNENQSPQQLNAHTSNWRYKVDHNYANHQNKFLLHSVFLSFTSFLLFLYCSNEGAHFTILQVATFEFKSTENYRENVNIMNSLHQFIHSIY